MWEDVGLKFCDTEAAKVATGDFNGDKKDDIICLTKNGYADTRLATSTGTFDKTPSMLVSRIFVFIFYRMNTRN